jgi:glutamate--cysteine ligase
MTVVREFPPHDTGSEREVPARIAARALADRAEGEAYVASVCFKHGPPRLVGAEIEYTVHHAADPRRPLDPAHLAAALGPHTPRTLRADSPAQPLPAGSPLSLEPGGQVEISAAPATSLAELAETVTADLTYLTERLTRSGLTLGTSGIDSYRTPARLLSTERYTAMERRFAPDGTAGLTMMCSTAGLQVCVDTGEREQLARRWAVLHALGPVLIALFANSGRSGDASTAAASARWLAVMGTEPARTLAHDCPDDPAASWARRMMDTPLLVLPGPDRDWDAPAGLTFGQWIEGAGVAASLAPPTTADLDYHLTTMFTPVRPRGYLEVRYLDAQPPHRWLHPVALLSALLARPEVVDSALEACEPVAGCWEEAARSGLAHPAIAAAAAAVADLGCAALGSGGSLGLPPATATDIADTLQRRLAHKEARR